MAHDPFIPIGISIYKMPLHFSSFLVPIELPVSILIGKFRSLRSFATPCPTTFHSFNHPFANINRLRQSLIFHSKNAIFNSSYFRVGCGLLRVDRTRVPRLWWWQSSPENYRPRMSRLCGTYFRCHRNLDHCELHQLSNCEPYRLSYRITE